MAKLALDYFQRIGAPHAERSATSRSESGGCRRSRRSKSVRAVAVGADDEFDRAFDDILGGGKLP